jgi:hypothetical protein
MSAATNASTAAAQPGTRKRGGQPGNTNALKHGFYTKNFSLAERRGLQATEGVVLGMRSACCVSSSGALQSRSRAARA